MKPYMVKITVNAVVMAEDESHAHEVTKDELRDIFRYAYRPLIDVQCAVTSEDNLNGGWDMECIPYGGDGNTRIGDLIGGEA